MKSGYVAIVGRPNVGKSTLLNYLLGYDLAIVTKKPETTRDKILGTLTTKEGQINFLDTPGIHSPHTLLGKHMVKQAHYAMSEVDLILALIDAKSGVTQEDERMFELIGAEKKPAILLINKADLIDRRLLLPMIEKCNNLKVFKECIPISATKEENLDVILPKLFENLPEGPKYFPDDHLTDRPVKFQVAELIRQQVLGLTQEEIPYSVAVLVDQMKKRPGKKLYFIQATIFVERKSQKPIIIGKRGSKLKEIGEAARKKIEETLNKRVYLELWVKIQENWRKDPRALKMLGYA